ncbi:MAG TPA: sugar phosphate nucleotidyltransferase [Chloroflexota bacterium]|nr:sugar phosphate nucleotidyltransferase [Chloroflexota bacterium]
MKVVLFCGGFGMRMREASAAVPKPLIPVGQEPILVHIMKYYAHYGHTEFILCLGYQGEVIRSYFEDGRSDVIDDLVLARDGWAPDELRRQARDWKIHFVETGLQSNIGTRLQTVREYIGDDEYFLAGYSDGLTDAPLPAMIAGVREQGAVASFLAVKPTYSFHVVSFDEGNRVRNIEAASDSDIRINGGYFVLRSDIFDFMQPGDELVEQPFLRLIAAQKLLGYRYDGFWAPMDTLKDRQDLNTLFESGERPWAVWEKHPSQVQPPAVSLA